jgi:2-haloacid dehalogenase
MLEYFDDLFISEEVGHPKPSAAFFDACFERLGGVGRNEAVMIGDSLTADIYGGKEYGLSTIWFNFEGRDVPKDLGDTEVVWALSEILEIV